MYPSRVWNQLSMERSCFIFVLFFFLIAFRFAGQQVHASEDDGTINHAAIRDLDEETDRLEKFGAELEAE